MIAPPPEMEPWLARTFGEVEATLRQRIIRVTNRWTFEGATFNPLRSRRPGSGATQTARQAPAQAGPLELPPELRERITATEGDDFCDPEHRTPADSFGRVRGQHVVTAANVAKAEGWHSVAIFDRHDPLAIDAALIADLLAVAGAWAQRAHEAENAARYFFLLWNCLQRAGASLIHGHAQMTLSTTMAHARVELWRAAAARYRQETGGDYFADLAAVHAALGLAVPVVDSPVTMFASLTPAKEREFVLLADPWRDDGDDGEGGQTLALESLARAAGRRTGGDASYAGGARLQRRHLRATAPRRPTRRGVGGLSAGGALRRSWQPPGPHLRYRRAGTLRQQRHRQRPLRCRPQPARRVMRTHNLSSLPNRVY